MLNGSYILGNCLDALKEYPDNYFHIAIVDPPYGINEGAHLAKSRTKLCKTKDYPAVVWDQGIPSQEYFDQLFRVSKNQIIWGINYFTGSRELPDHPGRIFWDKVTPNNDFSDGELAYCSFHNRIRQVEYMWNGMQQGKSLKHGRIQQGNKRLNEERIHPTQKPVILYRWLLREYAKPGDLIVDTHVGSGSSLIACEIEGYQYVGFENDETHYNDSMRRIRRHLKQLSIF